MAKKPVKPTPGENDGVADVKRKMQGTKPPPSPLSVPVGYCPTGSTLLNLAISGSTKGGWAKGRYHFLVGDSGSGKTWFSLTCFAEAAQLPEFDNYRFIFDNVEKGALMDMARYFGQSAANRIEAPDADADGLPIHSSTVMSFYFHLTQALDDGRPFIYVLDSIDGLRADADDERFTENMKLFAKGKEMKGSYGMTRAREHSQNMNAICARLELTESILIVIGQTRTNVTGYGDSRTRANGDALTFYNHLEAWTKVSKPIKRKINDKDRFVGAWVDVWIDKNRVSGWIKNSIEVPFYMEHGFDDVGSLVRYLVDENVWTKSSEGVISPSGLVSLKAATEEKLIQQIQNANLEDQLRNLVQETWDKIREKLRVNRKRNYT